MIFAGILNHSKSLSEINQIAKAISQNLSRTPEDIPKETRIGDLTLISTNPNLSESLLTITQDEQGLTLISGHPYFCSEFGTFSATQQCENLGHQIAKGDMNQLGTARGSYCGVSYSLEKSALFLFTDKVGIFPVYYYKDREYLIFSSALRVIAEVLKSTLMPNIEATTEILALGYPLGDSTQYQDVSSIRGGTILKLFREKSEEHKYWSWDNVKPNNQDGISQKYIIYKAFLDSVTLRQSIDTPEISFLSGGLDSRCVAAALINIGKKVHTLNFAPEGSQDFIFGRMASEALGTIHFERKLGSGNFYLRQKQIINEFCTIFSQSNTDFTKQPRVWSGDGGSVGVGHVYLDHKFVELLRGSTVADSISYFFKKHKISIPLKITNNLIKFYFRNGLMNKIENEITKYKPVDLGKRGFFFLLDNDQRRHLSEYFENIDILRYELILPFFDAKLLEIIVASNIEDFLYHDFYNIWLHQFGEATSTTPWQSYPEHAPCPIPLPNIENLRYQWTEDWFDAQEKRNIRRRRLRNASRLLFSKEFPHFFFSRKKFLIALILDFLKISDFDYIFDSVEILHKLFNAAPDPQSNAVICSSRIV